MRVEKLAAGLGWPEGPTVLLDGRLVFVEPYRSQLSVWQPSQGVTRHAYTGGSPNAVVRSWDGCLYVCQDGGAAEEPVSPSIQRVFANGQTELVATEVDGVRLTGPNDLTFSPDGRLYFTDPGRYDPEQKPDLGYIFAIQPGGPGCVVLELGREAFPNGIAADRDGSIVWAESYSGLVRRWMPDDGSIVDISHLPDLDGIAAVPDGLALSSDGDIFVTSVGQGGIYVVSPEGQIRQFIRIGARPTNCAFDGHWLYVTDAGPALDHETARFGGALWRTKLEATGFDLYAGGPQSPRLG